MPSLKQGRLCSRALTKSAVSVYSIRKRTPAYCGRKDIRHEKTCFSFSDIRAALRAPRRLRRTGAAGAGGDPGADRRSDGNAGADAHTHARTDRNAGTHARAGRGRDHGRRLPLGQYRRLHADPPRRRPPRPPPPPRRQSAASPPRTAARGALSVLAYPGRSLPGPYRRGGRPRRRVRLSARVSRAAGGGDGA